MSRTRKAVLWSCFGLCLYLAAEAVLPPSSQPSARAGLALIHAYQATGSKAAEASGIQCRYRPTCSHYAEDAVAHYGTLGGVARTAGRLWRCSPWGGSGYDPAVEPHAVAYVDPQETPEQKRQREQVEKEWAKFKKDVAPEAGAACAAGTIGCAIFIGSVVVGLAVQIFMMVFAFKDAKARGDQNAVLWLVLIFFVHLVGFIVYMIARPKGELIPCPNCKQRKLDILTKCPHCAADIGPTAKPTGP